MRQARWGLVALSFLVAALLASLGANIVLFKSSDDYYRDLNATRLDPLGLEAFPAESEQDSARVPGETLVVFFGDSRAAQWPAPKVPGVRFVNRGVGAQTTAQSLGRFAAHVEPLRPDLVIVQVGINDLKTIPLFPDHERKIIDRCKANTKAIVDHSLELGAKVILTTVIPPAEVPLERRVYWSDRVSAAVDEVNAYVRSLEGPSVTVFEPGRVLADDRGIVRAEYSLDFLHLNATGYAKLNNALVRVLADLAP